MKLKRTFLAIAAFALAFSHPARAQFSATAEQAPRGNVRISSGGLQFSSADQFNGSVAAGQASSTQLELSLQDAIDRGLKANLGLLVRGTLSSAARADRLRALSALLPKLNAGITETEAQIDLAVYGFRASGFPTVVGPFNYTDVRASASSYVFDWPSLKNLKAAAESARAADLSLEDGRDLVVQSVASGYFAILADTGRVDSTRTQAQTAETLYNIAKDRHQAGISAAIDELRAQVELKSQQQRLVSAENVLARDKLALGRVIGLPLGQAFHLTNEAPYVPLENLDTDDLLRKAYELRGDYRSAEAQVRAAEIARQAADGERYPTAYVTANYGVVGPTLNNSHGTFSVTGSVNVNLFDGGRIRADQQSASAEIQRRRNEMDDLRGKIDFEVRTALLQLSTAADQVALARSNVDLANQTLNQARDRFGAGVADTIEVVQAQEALAGASQDAINSLYAHNLAKVSLARAVGGTEASLRQFLGGR
jgi:outer membrane protein TolC